jgi:hypothetical protein
VNGYYNVAEGIDALTANVSGASNVAVGPYTLFTNNAGSENVAVGSDALYNNVGGNTNIAVGQAALYDNVNGSNNIAIGDQAALDVTGSNNIEIGSVGASADSGAIRIGTPTVQTAAYMAGISTSRVTGSAVFVTSHGQLGVLASSERYKTAIATMDATTQKIQALRPVTFHLKNDPQGTAQFGLIAEEVDKVYPELVIRDDDGKIQGVRYDELAPLLLNEVQHQTTELAQLKDQIADLKRTNDSIQAALAEWQAKERRVAMR